MTTRRELAELNLARAEAAIAARFGRSGRQVRITKEWKEARTCYCAICNNTFYIPLLCHADARFLKFKDEHTPRVPLCSPQCEQRLLDEQGLR